MKRRQFIKRSTAAATLPILLGGFSIHAFGRNPKLALMTNLTTETDHVLVLVQLNGGNDGLNTILPLDQYTNLAQARANILIPDTQALTLSGATGIHPAMGGMKSLFDETRLAVVQSVGYPDPNFSHFRATDIWTTASDADQYLTTGWLGRYLNTIFPDYPTGYPSAEESDPPAITIGSIVSSTCQGPVVNLGLAISDPDAYSQLITGGTDPVPNTPYGHELQFLRQTMVQTNQYLSVIQDAAAQATNLSTLYPAAGQNKLADQLKIVAQLIAGGLKTRVYITSLGGFDTHAAQTDSSDTTTGQHADLLGALSQAITAFQDDLDLLGVADRVVGLTYSEFGRRIKSNASLGTDHGTAAPLFVFGTRVNGQVFGANPVIPAGVSSQDNLPMQYDFRSVYGSLLTDWFGVDPLVMQELLFDDFQHIPLIKGQTPIDLPGSSAEGLSLLPAEPNPFAVSTRIRFSTKGGKVQVRIFNSIGQTITVLSDQTFAPGEHEITWDASGLPSGVYYCRIQQGNAQAVQALSFVGE